jgi:hypothetical protein
MATAASRLLSDRLRAQSGVESWLCHFSQLAHAAYFHPFDNVNIACVIETGAMGTDELTWLEMIAG